MTSVAELKEHHLAASETVNALGEKLKHAKASTSCSIPYHGSSAWTSGWLKILACFRPPRTALYSRLPPFVRPQAINAISLVTQPFKIVAAPSGIVTSIAIAATETSNTSWQCPE